jgi:hypothetical protein
MTTARRRFALSVLALVASTGAAATLTGCGGIREEIFWNPSPELATAAQTEDQVANQMAITADVNRRGIRGDLGRTVFYTDRPSRLAPYPSR